MNYRIRNFHWIWSCWLEDMDNHYVPIRTAKWSANQALAAKIETTNRLLPSALGRSLLKPFWSTKQNILRNQIDFILPNQRFQRNVKLVKIYPGADAGSGPNPVVMEFRLHRFKKNHETSKYKKYKYRKIRGSWWKRTIKKISKGKWEQKN